MTSPVLDTLTSLGIDESKFDQLASNLVWRVGRLSDDAPVTIRIGLASSVPLFADLPKLRNASESEIEEAIKADDIRVEWVGRKL